MGNIDDLKYVIGKVQIELTIARLANLAAIYQQVINDKLVEIVEDRINQMSNEDFSSTEKISNDLANQYSNSVIVEINAIMNKILIEKKSYQEIENEYTKNIADFAHAVQNLSEVVMQQYSRSTILDDQLELLRNNSSNQEITAALHYLVNKVNCYMSIDKQAGNVINEINIAINAYTTSNKKSHLDLAKNYYQDFKDFNYLLETGYKNVTPLDKMITDSLVEKILEINNFVSIGKEMELSLLGINN